jgi:hypothetical protein
MMCLQSGARDSDRARSVNSVLYFSVISFQEFYMYAHKKLGRKFSLTLSVGKTVNLLELTQSDPEADSTDCVHDLIVADAEWLESSSPREVRFKLPNGAIFKANNETGKVTWENAILGTAEVLFDRINYNRRPREMNRQ